jgi:hypothetical protein
MDMNGVPSLISHAFDAVENTCLQKGPGHG